MINLQDRKDFLLDTGVSPGEDDSYDKQASKLLMQQEELRDDAKRNILQKLDTSIRTMRESGAPEGPPKPLEFLAQVLGKSIPAPSELNPVNLVKAIPELAKGAVEVARHPLVALKHAALNPPELSTIAAMLTPGLALKAYRGMAPLRARTYLHHMAGIPTPFTHVTEAERVALTKVAQERIDHLLSYSSRLNQINASRAAELNTLRFAPLKEVLEAAKDLDLHVYRDMKHLSPKQLRKRLIKQFRENNTYPVTVKKYTATLGNEADNVNVRAEYKKITGKKLPGFQIMPTDETGISNRFYEALGKTYVEPMIEKGTDKIVPKAIHDTYKFYPEVYDYAKGEGISVLRNLLKSFKNGTVDGFYGSNINASKFDKFKTHMEQIFSSNSHEPLGILLRKLAFGRPTSIINIPLTKPGPMNAYDKAALLLGSKPLMDKRK